MKYHEFETTGHSWPNMELCKVCGQPKGNYKHIEGKGSGSSKPSPQAGDGDSLHLAGTQGA